MNTLKNITLVLLLLFCFKMSIAQDTPWGKAKIVSVDEATKTIKYSYAHLNDFFYIKQGATEKDFLVGNEHLEVTYSQVQENKLHLTKINKGEEYLTQLHVGSQSKYGFIFKGDKKGLNKLMSKLVELTHKSYHPYENFKAKYIKADDLYNALVLYGDGLAYYGFQKEDGTRQGRGTYIMANKDTYKGRWKDNAQDGIFTVTRDGEFRASGEFVNAKMEGIWKYCLEDLSYQEHTYTNGELQSEETKFKAQEPNLKTGVESGKIYISCYTEVFKDGTWKEEWRVARKKYIIESYDDRHMFVTRDGAENYFRHKARLVNVTEDADKRVETYDYTFEFGIGHSSPTITIFKSPQTTPDDQPYDILFYFPHGKGDYRYYIQHDDIQLKKDRELTKQINDTQQMIQEILDREEKKEKEKKKKQKN